MKAIIIFMTGCLLSHAVYAAPQRAQQPHREAHKPMRVAKHAVAQPAISVRKEAEKQAVQTK